MSMQTNFSQYMPQVVELLLGKPNPHHSKPGEPRWGTNGSLKINLESGVWNSFEGEGNGGVLDLIIHQGEAGNRAEAVAWLESKGIHKKEEAPKPAAKARVVARYDYTDEHGEVLFQVERLEPKSFRQRRPAPNGKWIYKGVSEVRKVPYRLPELLQRVDEMVFIPEGEKDVNNLYSVGLVATCNAGGAGKWTDELTPFMTDRDVVILPDNDAAGVSHRDVLVKKLLPVAKSVRVLELSGLSEKGDVSDWLAAGGAADKLVELALAIEPVRMDAPVHLTTADKAVMELNERHALVLTGGKAMIFRDGVGHRGERELQYLTIGAFSDWLRNETVMVEHDETGKWVGKHRPLADVWLRSPFRRQYEGVTFAPANNAPDCYYNLWSGYAIQPLDCGLAKAAMKCRRLLRHAKYVLCKGNKVQFRYLLAWAADMLQDPDEKKGTALVMRGLKGTGKSTFVDFLDTLLGRHSIKVTHMRHLTGNFNRHLADKLLVVAEETFWAGDKAEEGALKEFISGNTITIEAKGVDAVKIPSATRVAMITNNEWAVPASSDERRYFVLDVSDHRRGDFDYFAAIHEQMKGNDKQGLRALLTVLLNFPLNGVNMRKVPETDGLRKQRALSMEPHDQFIYDALCDAEVAGKAWNGSLTILKDDVYASYAEAARRRGKVHLLTKAQLTKKIEASISVKATKSRIYGGELKPVYVFPRHSEAVSMFTKYSGVDVECCQAIDEEAKPF